MSLDLSDSLKGRRLALIASDLDAAATPGAIRFYSAPKPAVGASITTQVLQAVTPLADPCATLSGTVLTFATGADGVRVAGDTITWARFVDGDGVFVADANVSGPAGGATVLISSVTGAIGSLLRVLSGTVSE
jgi:hypothetical protein